MPGADCTASRKVVWADARVILALIMARVMKSMMDIGATVDGPRLKDPSVRTVSTEDTSNTIYVRRSINLDCVILVIFRDWCKLATQFDDKIRFHGQLAFHYR